MVYCSKCGTQNEDNAAECSSCGAPLRSAQVLRMSRSRERRQRDECFGLPNSGAIAGAVFGLLIILWGLSIIFGWEFNLMALIAVIFGTLIVAGAIYGLRRG